ncbi:MAG: hypothetical protein A2991_01060 [Candidatus Terrybacteria bacterium RIFCSPLOWO2_01_FULL_58_14]|uniref:Rod shape-determining protein RodA n=2 Tax=Candidatus Terryibacteriota TaxID=1817920 RepID=A0A1G2PX05_9BACT|nr:MAG: hypothetical protein A2991_01060 [Candidatus Terrybacteria bacterium RIFCSPLOWO2_01_FULL_58_14]
MNATATMMRLVSFLTALDRWLLAAIVLLGILGLLNLAALPGPALFLKQSIFIAAGFILFAGFALFDYRILRSTPLVGMAVWGSGVGLLALVALIGEAVRGAQNWIYLGPISIGPIEIVKLGSLLMLAHYFAREHRGLVFPGRVALSALAVIVPITFAFLQPDLGAVALLAMLWFGSVLILRIPLRTVVAIVLLVIFAATFAWGTLLHDYQRARVLAFLHPQDDPLGAAYQSRQAIVAVGAGGLTGRGIFAEDLISRLSFLPESSTDFAFSAIVERTGFFGALLMLSAFAVILWRIGRVAIRATNNFSCAYAIGLLVLLASEISLHVGMNLGMIPVSGLPLPFVSYGGSHLLTTFAALGILESIRLHQPGFVRSDRDASAEL